MSIKDKCADYGAQLTPKENRNIAFGKTSLQVNPKIDSTIPPAENFYTFLVTKSFLDSTDILIRTKLQVFGDLTNNTPLVSEISCKYISSANNFVKDHTNISIASCHSSNGRTINIYQLGDGDLRACENVASVDRRPENITFTKIEIDLDFHELDYM